MRKTYLGDGVFAEYDGWRVRLSTDNGYGLLDTIYLEPEVYINLITFVAAVRKDREILPPSEEDNK